MMVRDYTRGIHHYNSGNIQPPYILQVYNASSKRRLIFRILNLLHNLTFHNSSKTQSVVLKYFLFMSGNLLVFNNNVQDVSDAPAHFDSGNPQS